MVDPTPPSVDGIAPPAEPAPEEQGIAAAKTSHQMRNVIIFFFGVPYLAYLGWMLFLLSFFPHPAGAYGQIQQLGSLSAVIGLVVFLLLGVMFFMRAMKAKGPTEDVRKFSIVRIVIMILPGIILSAITPIKIIQEPPLYIQVIEPTAIEEMVAPLSITFSVEKSLEILNNRGLRAKSFAWDFDGDGEPNDETVTPRVTAFFERPGSYRFVGKIFLTDGSVRRIVRTFAITDAVFSVLPLRPVVDQPVKFSVEHLLAEDQEIKEVQWDFENDGEVDIITDQTDAVHIYYRTGKVPVHAVVTYDNQKQDVLDREIEIFEPIPPPFPISIETQPEHLISPAPFGTMFKVVTEEPLREVKWDFGDDEESTGETVGHTFEKRGNFAVTVEARSETGDIAKLSKIVQIVQTLVIPDLSFDGTHEVKNHKIVDEVPVTLELKPRTNLPLITFIWEAPEATVVNETDTEIKAVYRRSGKYTVTLLAHDPDGKAVRIPIELEVKPPTSKVSIYMEPEGGTAPLNVLFDASETVIPNEEISGFEWSFADADDRRLEAKDIQQRGAQVEYLFEKAGTYKVTLRALTTVGNSYEATRTIVIRAPILDACITVSRDKGKSPLGIKFNMSCSAGMPSKVTWDFGDGSQSDERNPVHVFEAAGTYLVKLMLKDDSGSVSSNTITITAQ